MIARAPRTDQTFPVAPVAEVPRLALSVRELATSLGVSERSLASWTKDGRGPPSCKVGNLRLYPVDGCRQWLLDQAREESEE